MAERVPEMIEPGTEIEVTEVTEVTEAIGVIEVIEAIAVEEVTEMTEGHQDVMRDAMTSKGHRDGTEISLQTVWIEAQAAEEVVGPQEVIETNLLCRWVAETGRRARVLRPRRKSLPRT